MVTLGGLIISENKDLLKSTIKYLRKLNIFDEIVVVADIDNGEDIEKSAKLADKYTLMNFNTPEKAIDTVCSLSTCEWQFRLDDDERIGKKFVNEIKSFIEIADKDAYWFPRMWLYPDNKHFLNCYHWYPDYQVRLWRKDHLKAELWYHTHPKVVGISGSVDWNLFHYILINRTYEERLERCRIHSSLMGISYEGFINGIGLFYLPENMKDKLIIDKCIEKTVR